MYTILLKSFYKNNKTKLYIILFSLLLCVFPFLKFANEYYVNKVNKFHEGSYIEFKTEYSKYNNIISNFNVNYVTLGKRVSLKDNGNQTFIFQALEYNLNENEIIGSPRIYNEYDLMDIVKFDNIDYSFVLKDKKYYKDELTAINYDTFFKLIDKNDIIIYRLYIKDWSKLKKTIRYLNNEVGFKINIYDTDDDIAGHIDFFVPYFAIIMIVFSISIVVLIMVLRYVLFEKNLYFYYCLGLSKIELIIYRIVKILSFIIISFLIFFLFISLIKFIV